MNNIIVILLLIVGIIPNSFSQKPQGLTREKTIELYKKLYITSELSSMPWNGDVEECDGGTLNNDIYEKVENRINFFRLVNGLPKVKINRGFSKEAQKAALLIKANKILTHDPSSAMICYSDSADEGCKKSCLEFSDYKFFPTTAFITGFIEDDGDRNYFVGHRRWILYSKLKEIGYGATDSTEALLTVDGIAKDSIGVLPEYTAYPWNGYVPVNLIFPKWSFSIPENNHVDFSNASINMTDSAGKKIELNKLNIYTNYLDHTLVWIVTGLFSAYEITYGINNLGKNGYLNKKIKVTITNVKVNGVIKNYTYSVVPIKI